MASIKRFEDIEAWKKARTFTFAIYKTTENGHFSRDHCLKDQTRRAAISIMLNSAEGFGRKTDKDFNKYLVQAHSSCCGSTGSSLYRP